MMHPVRYAWLAVWLMSFPVCAAGPEATTPPTAVKPIAEQEITSLAQALAGRQEGASAVRRRLALKSVIRKGKALLESHPAAPNRFLVLGTMLQAHKQLLRLDNTDRNRDALFDTCRELAQAPDEYADARLEADMLLSERAMAIKNASLAQRAEALAEVVKRYRDTSAEAKSLMMAALIAPKLEAHELERSVLQAMDKRFGGDPEVIEFRRKHLGISKLDVLFVGTYTRADGGALRFPIDWMGRQGMMVFWSRQTPGFEAYLKLIKEQEGKLPGRLEVFSFNVDELPDAGASTLKALGLNWTVMRLPGGKKSQAYRTYAGKDPVGVFVNAYGRAMLTPTMLDPATQARLGVRGASLPLLTLSRRLNDARYLSQLQSLLVGDFLVMEPDGSLDPARPPELKTASVGAKLSRTADSVPAETLLAIQECFTPAPFRYRLKAAEALARYEKAENLCAAALRQHPEAPDLWIVRNRRMVALLGMWKLGGKPEYLHRAAAEAKASLTTTLPRGADVVARFCLAKEAIRRADALPEAILSTLVDQAGGPAAPASALAAAAILALEADARQLHERYRGAFLEAPGAGDARLWSVASFLRDRYHRFCLLRASHIRHERSSLYGSIRGYIVAHGEPSTMGRLPEMELKTLDNAPLELPPKTADRLTLLLFVEPPADKTETQFSRETARAVRYATDLRDRHVHKEVSVIAAFLCDDANRVDALMKANQWTCRSAIVPGGLANPLVRRLGVLSADRLANIFLLRRDGSVAWHMSGFKYDDFGFPFAAYLAMKVHMEVCDAETAYDALVQGDYGKAVRYFATAFDPEGDQRYQWAGPRLHGRALAHMKLQKWEAALTDIDAAIEAHQKGFSRGRPCPCDIVAEMRLTRAVILDQLGRPEEAKAARQRAAGAAKPHSETPYGLFHEKLRKFRLSRP
jgi:tetratricopeptide (TPR) repeat protein